MSAPKKKTIKIDDPEFWKVMGRQLSRGHILENLVFPEGQDISPYDYIKETAEAMEKARIRKELIYAFIKTERMVSEKNKKYLTKDEKQEWVDAVEQYQKLVKSGALQPSDSLLPFIKASKEVPNPRLNQEELSFLFDVRNFHTSVISSSRNQFINYDFPSCVFSAHKKLLVEIQNKSCSFKEDGSRLVTSVFNPNAPILQSSIARISSDKSIQEGIMHLFMGSVLCIRNVFAHKEVYLTNVNDTLEYLSFASFLFKVLDALEVSERDQGKQTIA